MSSSYIFSFEYTVCLKFVSATLLKPTACNLYCNALLVSNDADCEYQVSHAENLLSKSSSELGKKLILLFLYASNPETISGRLILTTPFGFKTL